jgi:hypothetical protein
MSDEANEKANKTWLYVVGCVTGLLFLYVLSIGPATVLLLRKIIPQKEFALIYAPLDWFCNRTDTWDAVGAYMKMWCELTGTPWQP